MVASAGWKQLTVLVVGYGSSGKRHYANLEATGHRLLSFDPNIRPRPIGGVQSYSDGLKMASHVLIASPAKLHASQAIKALEARKEVFIEKPMAMDVKEGEAIMSAAEAAGKTVAVGYNWRAYNPVKQLRDQINSIKPIHAELAYGGDKSEWPGSCYDDLLLECSHELDLLRFLFPQDHIQPIKAIVNSDQASIQYTLRSNGVSRTAHITLDWAATQKVREWAVYGIGRSVSKGYDGRNSDDVKNLNEAYRSEIAAWLMGKPICIGEDGLKVLRDIDRIRELAK